MSKATDVALKALKYGVTPEMMKRETEVSARQQESEGVVENCLICRGTDPRCTNRKNAVGEWAATAQEINELPESVRKWIHALESRCDPAGDLRGRKMAEDTVRAIEHRSCEGVVVDVYNVYRWPNGKRVSIEFDCTEEIAIGPHRFTRIEDDK